jgi:hypothetical protein
VRDVRPNLLQVSRRLVRLAFQQFLGFAVNFVMPLGKFLNQFLGHPFNLKIAARIILHPIAKPIQRPDQFVIINILGKLFSRQHFANLQRLPTALDRIARGIEQDAMAVQVRV